MTPAFRLFLSRATRRAALIVPVLFAEANFAQSLQTFTACVGPNGTGATCTLPTGTYHITQTITIGRSNITVTGGSTSPSQTVLVRDPVFTGSLIDVSASQPLTGIKIEYLTFCGNSTLSNPNPSSACPAPVESSVVQTCNHETEYQTGNYSTNPNISLCVDLYVHSADSGANPADPFAYTGPYSLEIANSDFEDATGHAIALWPDIEFGDRVNDIYIHDSTIAASGVTGILIGANGINFGPNGRVCDAYSNYNNAAGLGPRNLRIESNTFRNNNTSSVASESGRWIGLRNNTFVNNFINPQVKGNEAGGNVFMDACTDTSQIYSNTMTGPTNPPYDNTSGLELWGRNIDAEGNNISGYPNEGIAANSTFNATIKNNQLLNNDNNRGIIGYSIGGIVVTTAGYAPCDGVPRDNQNTMISGNTSTSQAYGIDLFDRGVSRNVIDSLTITRDNTLQPNATAAIWQDWMVNLNGFLNQSGDSPVLSAIPPNDSPGNPTDRGPVRALPVLNSTNYPLCPASGLDADRDTFTFSTADANGPGNLNDLEVVFSVGGNDANGSGGPDGGGHGCHFIFFPSFSTLFLDGPNGGYNWSGSSVVGPGGTDLSNGYCTVHAGSSASQVQMGPRNLDLTLDISFTSTGSNHLHIYEVALDANGTSSYGGGWYYWGWWAAP